jgi:hypothetical protein
MAILAVFIVWLTLNRKPTALAVGVCQLVDSAAVAKRYYDHFSALKLDIKR